MADKEEIIQESNKVHAHLANRLDSSEEILMALEIIRMNVYRNVNMYDLDKGYHLNFSADKDSE